MIAITSLTVPAVVDRPQFVLNQADNSVALLEQQRWAAPLKEQISSVLAVDLSRRLGDALVTAWPQTPPASTTFTVNVGVQRFESRMDQGATLEAVWQVLDARGVPVQSGRIAQQEAIQGSGYAALAAAHERAVGKLADDIAAAIALRQHKPANSRYCLGGRALACASIVLFVH